MAVVDYLPGVSAAWWDEFEDPPGYRAEVIRGELVLSPSPNRAHQRALKRLLRILDDACPPEFEVLPDYEWRLDVGGAVAQAPRPDLVVTSVAEGRITEPPLLAVEILSDSDQHSLEFRQQTRIEGKRQDYRRNGLQWYLEVGFTEACLYERVHPPRKSAEWLWRARIETIGDELLQATRPFPFSFTTSDLFLP